MQYTKLKNFGKLHTADTPPRVQINAITWLSGQLGITTFPRFLARVFSEDRYWKRYHFTEAAKRGITHQEFIAGVQISIATYKASIAVCGKDRGEEIYSEFTKRQGLMLWEDFFPDVKDFLRFPDPWKALRQYFVEYFRVNRQEGVFKYEVALDTDTDLHFKLTDCAWHAMFKEVGCPNLASIAASVDVVFLPRLLEKMGVDFKREHWICRGDHVCDWHFCRRSIAEEGSQRRAAPTISARF